MNTYIAHISSQLLNARGACPMLWLSLVAVSLLMRPMTCYYKAHGLLFSPRRNSFKYCLVTAVVPMANFVVVWTFQL